jgi:hypothetical protein
MLLVLLALLVPWQAALHPLHTVPKRTPTSLGLPFEDVRFLSRDGTRLAAWLMPHPEARANVIYCHGQNDRLVPWAAGQELYAAYSGPKSSWWVKEAVHYNIRQSHPEEYRHRLESFVEECLKAPARF